MIMQSYQVQTADMKNDPGSSPNLSSTHIKNINFLVHSFMQYYANSILSSFSDKRLLCFSEICHNYCAISKALAI